MRQALNDHTGRVLGYIDSDAQGNLRLTAATGRLLGTYRPSINQTYDATGRMVGTGNLLSMLLGAPSGLR